MKHVEILMVQNGLLECAFVIVQDGRAPPASPHTRQTVSALVRCERDTHRAACKAACSHAHVHEVINLSYTAGCSTACMQRLECIVPGPAVAMSNYWQTPSAASHIVRVGTALHSNIVACYLVPCCRLQAVVTASRHKNTG